MSIQERSVLFTYVNEEIIDYIETLKKELRISRSDIVETILLNARNTLTNDAFLALYKHFKVLGLDWNENDT